MAIQMRRGNYNNYDPAKMLPGELAVTLQNDPRSENGKALHVSFGASDEKTLMTFEDAEGMIEDAVEEAAEQAAEQAAEEATADAVDAALKSEGFAVGKQNGTDVGSGSPYYHNNAKYYLEQAEAVAESIPEDYSELSDDVDDLKGAFSNTIEHIDTSELTWYEGHVIYNSGNPTAAMPGGSCKVSEPIFLRKGQMIVVDCSGYAQVTSIISKVLRTADTPQNSYYQPLIKDKGTVIAHYSYVCQDDMFVAVTYYYGGNVPVEISIVNPCGYEKETIKSVAADLDFLTDNRVYTTTGFNTYVGWYSSDYIPLENIKDIVYLKATTFSTIYTISFFNKSREFISGVLPNVNLNNRLSIYAGSELDIPSGAYYFRIAGVMNDDDIYGEIGYVSCVRQKSKTIDLTNMFTTNILWKNKSVTTSYANWYATDYIDLQNVRKISKLNTFGHSYINALTFFDQDKNVTRYFLPSSNNEWYSLSDIEIKPNEKYAVIVWGEIEYNGVLTRSCDVVLEIEQIYEENECEEDFCYLVSQFDKILCIGDSLTQGDYGSYPEGTANTHTKNYPHYLERYLNTDVTNMGRNGSYPRWWWNNKSIIDTTVDYDCIFFFLGTNFGLSDTIEEDTASGNYETYSDTETGRYCSMIEWLEENFPNAKIFLISFPHNYRTNGWFISNNMVLRKIGGKYNLPVVDMTVDVPFTQYNGDIYRPVGYDPNGTERNQIFGNLHFGTLGYQTFAEYLIRNTGKIMNDNLISYKGKLD